jgi:hypothetical protein
MKKLKINGIHELFVEHINKMDAELQSKIKELKSEHNTIIIDEKVKLLMMICQGEGLDFNEMKTKYLKSKEIASIIIDNNVMTKDMTSSEENIMDIIEINGTKYYYEAKEKGIVYDMSSKAVGVYKNGMIVMDDTKQSID